MADEKKENAQPERVNQDTTIKSDPGTTNTTDPQEHMEGPLSSLMHKIENKAKTNEIKDAEDAEKKSDVGS